MAVVIVAVAGVIGVWGSRQKERQRRAVHDFVAALADDVQRGNDPAPRLRGTDRSLMPLVISRLEAVTALSGGTPAKFEIETMTGDTDAAGQVPAPATHTAILRVDGNDVLGLRLVHRDPPGDVVIIGYWTP